MRISSRVCAACIGVIGLSAVPLSSGPVRALDGNPIDAPRATLKVFASPQAALRQGMESLRAGNVKSSIEALTYAAENGHPLAQWKLGKMYAKGEGVPHDDLKAYRYFTKIIENYDEDSPDRFEVSTVASAFVTVGVYSLNGIPNSPVRPDPSRALEMFQYSAINFGDPNAEYNLARMYLDGTAVDRDDRRAAQWLNLAADKNHRESQALLGHLLFTGRGVPRQHARGLMWLTLAREGAETSKDAWIIDLYNKDSAVADANDRQGALAMLDAQGRRRN